MRNYILLSLIVSCFVIITGCGNNDVVSAPYDGSLTISTSDYTGSSAGTVSQYRTRFMIVAKNAAGIPLDDVTLRITFIWAESDPAFPYDLYYDIYDIDSGVCDNTVPVVQLYDWKTTKDQPMSATTDEDGTYELWVGFLVGGFDSDCDGVVDVDVDGDGIYFTYYADIEVTSGSLYDKVKFTVEGGSD